MTKEIETNDQRPKTKDQSPTPDARRPTSASLSHPRPIRFQRLYVVEDDFHGGGDWDC